MSIIYLFIFNVSCGKYCEFQTLLSGEPVRSWQSWLKAYRVCCRWVITEMVPSLLSSHQLYVISSSVCPDCLWSTAILVCLHWSVY